MEYKCAARTHESSGGGDDARGKEERGGLLNQISGRCTNRLSPQVALLPSSPYSVAFFFRIYTFFLFNIPPLNEVGQLKGWMAVCRGDIFQLP